MAINPMVAAVATLEPQTAPKMAQAKTLATARPQQAPARSKVFGLTTFSPLNKIPRIGFCFFEKKGGGERWISN